MLCAYVSSGVVCVVCYRNVDTVTAIYVRVYRHVCVAMYVCRYVSPSVCICSGSMCALYMWGMCVHLSSLSIYMHNAVARSWSPLTTHIKSGVFVCNVIIEMDVNVAKRITARMIVKEC